MPNLSDNQFNEGLNMAVKWVAECLSDKDHADFIPALLVHTIKEGDPDIGVSIVSIPSFEMDKRHEILGMVGATFGREKKPVVAIYFVTEVWISMSNADGSRKYPLPEQDPDRREAISVAALAYDGRAAMGEVTVTRNKRGKMIAGATTLRAYGGEVKVTNNVCKAFYRGFVLGVATEGQKP